MDGVDPDTLLEWLQMGAGEERDLQLMALEQLCMLLLMSDNIDRCFESCPPRSFLPALGRIFLDETAPENILEVTARAITYYLDVSNECTRRITQVDGAVKAICNRLVAADMTDRTSKDLAEQCVKLLEHICQREASAVYDAGGLQCMLHLIRQNDRHLHKDTMHSAMNVITRLCSKVDPHDQSLLKCSSDLGALLSHDDATISECALRCFAALTDRFIRKSLDPVDLAVPSGLVGRLLDALAPMPDESTTNELANTIRHSPAFISVVLSLISNLCRGSAAVTDQVTSSPKLILAIKSVLNSRDERCVMDSLRLADLLVVLLCEGRGFLPKVIVSSNSATTTGTDRTNRHLIDTIRQHDTDTLVEAVESGTVDANFVDDVGQTLLNWCSAFGTTEMVAYLCKKGADPNKGQRSSSLHYAACFGRPEIVKILLCHGANPDLHDEEGRTALEKARERNDDAHQRVVQLLESPSSYAVAGDINNASTSSPCQLHGSTDNNSGTIEEHISIDKIIRKNILQQLIPIFCNIYRNTLLGSVRRSTLLLVRKCIFHLSNEDINELVRVEKTVDNDIRLTENDFVANLMTVLGAAFGYEDDTDGKEQAILIMKNLLEKNKEFWLEQLIRLGIYEKVEALAASHENNQCNATNTQANEECRQTSDDVSTQLSLTESSAEHFNGKRDTNLDNKSISSTSSVGSVNIQIDAESAGDAVSHHRFSERAEMINIPVESDNSKHDSDANSSASPAIDKDIPRTRSSSAASVVAMTMYPRITSQLASVRDDLVEAATAVAQVLGVQIVDTGEDEDDIATDSTIAGCGSTSILTQDSKQNAEKHVLQSLASGINYKWNSWRLIRHNDAFYVWCDAVVIEFSESSNGWLRFIMNGRLSTMFSSGKVEPCSNETDSRAELISKIRRAKSSVFTEASPRELFTKFTYYKAGNWRINLDSSSGNQISVSNIDGLPHERKLLIKADMPGFTFVNGKNVTRTFSAEAMLGTEFTTGWAARNGLQHTENYANIQRKKLSKLAKELWENYLKEAKTKPRDALLALQNHALATCALVNDIYKIRSNLEIETNEYDDKIAELSNVLKKVRNTIIDNRLLSTFELSISNIVPALLHLLEVAMEKKCKPLVKCFLMVFSDTNDFHQLVRRIVLVLEHAEKFPQPLYDVPGGSPFGLQLLTRRFNLRLEQADAEDAEAQKHLMNRTDRTMKAEPLATIGSLRQYVYKMVARNWYDHPRENLTYVQKIKHHKAVGDELTFVYQSDFDTNGVLWYLGTNGRTVDDWTNPAIAKIVNVYCSDEANQPYGQPSDILSRDVHAINCHTSDSPNANFTIDLGVWMYPTKYTLRHSQDRGNSALRNWFLQGSRDAFVWDVLAIHKNEQTLNESGDTATWSIDDYNDEADDLREKRAPTPRRGPYRYFRIAQNGYNASGSSHILSLSGFEIYGAIVDVVNCELKAIEMQREVSSNSIKSLSSTNNATSSGIAALSSLIASKRRRQSLKGAISDSKNEITKSATETSPHDFPSLTSQVRPSTAAIRHTISMRKHRQKCSILDKNVQHSSKNEVSEKTENNTPTLRQKISYSAGTNSKLRMFRAHRNQSVNGTSPSCDTSSEQRNNSFTPLRSLLKIGARIVPGPDSTLCKNTEIVGTVVGIEKNGWVDVQWDDGSLNTYRFGHDGKYEIDLQNEVNSKSSLQFVNLKSQESKKPIDGILKSSKHFSSTINHDVSNLSAIEGIEEQQQLYNSQMDVPITNATTINQKSMSATNLFDERPPQYSVASSKQAASAESLQHQTPSLENLLARSRLQADRILEIVGDELQSPTSTDSRPFGSQESCHRNDTTDKSSISANAFAGGSQPTLSATPITTVITTELFNSTGVTAEHDNLLSSTSNSMTNEDVERDGVAELVKLPSSFMKRFSTDASDDKTVGKNSNEKECRSMSISEPNLLESTKNRFFSKIRQKSIEPSLADFANSSTVSDLNVVKMENQNNLQHVPVIALSSNTISPMQNVISSDHSEHGINTASDTIMDTDYLNRFINSAEFCEHLHANISNSTDSKVPKDEVNDTVIDKYVEDAILNEFMMSNHEQENVINELDGDNSAVAEIRENLPSATSSSRLTNNKQQQLTGFGNGLKAKLGSYADVLRGVMQQVVESSSGVINDNFDSDSMTDEIFDDDFLEAQNLIENNCDHVAPGEFIPHNFFAEIESLASATAAIRQHLVSRAEGRGLPNIESSSTSSSLSALMAAVSNANHWSGSVVVGTPSINVPHTSLSSNTTHESKLNWRQLFHGANLCDDYSKTRSNATNRSVVSAQRRAQRVWDDDYVLRRQFGALIPAFDPRPGRTNINQTQEVELSDDADARYVRRNSIVKQFFHSSPFKAEFEAAKKIRLHLKGPNLPNVENKILELNDGDATLFCYVQQLCESINWTDFTANSSKLAIPVLTSSAREQQHKSRRIWEPTYTVMYTCHSDSEDISATEKVTESAVQPTENMFDETIQQTLRLAHLLKSAAKQIDNITITDDIFHSSTLTQKLRQCLTDPLLVTANALPAWCGCLVYDFPYLFSTETRELYLKATAFGTSRAIAWLQSRRDQVIEQNRTSLPIGTSGTGYRREDHYQEYRIGRLKHERIKVHRDEDSLLENATRVMNFHAMRKSVLEIEYYGEEGTGLGPTLEFYAIVAAEFQRKSLAMWLCDDMDQQEAELELELDLGEGRKPRGYYVQRNGGLFPGYYPQKTESSATVAKLFKTLGTFLAKVLLDGRLVDIPLSSAFLKLLLTPSVCSENVPNLNNVLGINDLAYIQPLKAKFLTSLKEFIAHRDAIVSSKDLNNLEKCKLLDELRVGQGERACKLEDLALTFALNPPSRVFGWHNAELIENGANIDVTIDNVHDYVDKCIDFYLNKGIKEQVVAFREGFDMVFSLKSLTCFTSGEVQLLLFGEQCPQWSRDDLLRYTEPKLGYTRDSPVYLRFVDVLTEMSSSERKAFLQFATGCASLPPGGLANLHPRLTIVRKVDAETSAGSGGDGAYPSVNTCVHYLKLPEYSSTAILRERLLAATHEKGFHLN